VCEAFHCLPSQAREEIETDPDRTALTILELRAYAETKRRIDDAKKAEDAPRGPMADLVREMEVDLWRARKAGRG
jgi:hypothetical protein